MVIKKKAEAESETFVASKHVPVLASDTMQDRFLCACRECVRNVVCSGSRWGVWGLTLHICLQTQELDLSQDLVDPVSLQFWIKWTCCQ